MADENIIAVNVPNAVSILVMLAGGLLVLSVVGKLVGRRATPLKTTAANTGG